MQAADTRTLGITLIEERIWARLPRLLILTVIDPSLVERPGQWTE